jgi:hypothetical protein
MLLLGFCFLQAVADTCTVLSLLRLMAGSLKVFLEGSGVLNR